MGAGTRQRLTTIRGNVPHPSDRPAGCPFHPRCDSAVSGVCDVADPPEVTFGARRTARCVLYADDAGYSDDAGLVDGTAAATERSQP
jgi:peptide/nickel transport system ATP-binding protein